MKYEITHRGVYDANGDQIEVGSEVEVGGDVTPGYLIGKSVPVKAAKVAVTNPAKDPLPADDKKA